MRCPLLTPILTSTALLTTLTSALYTRHSEGYSSYSDSDGNNVQRHYVDAGGPPGQSTPEIVDEVDSDGGAYRRHFIGMLTLKMRARGQKSSWNELWFMVPTFLIFADQKNICCIKVILYHMHKVHANHWEKSTGICPIFGDTGNQYLMSVKKSKKLAFAKIYVSE